MSRIKRAVKGFIDPITTKVEDWKWRALADVDKELKLKEVPDYIQGGYGGFMADQLKRAEAGDLNARDLIKAYTITQSSIGRGGLSHATATKRGLKLPNTGGEVRPEGAFAEWLGSPLGQRYLDMAERGELDSKALKEIQAAFAPFGKQNDQVAKMEWAAQNLPGMATDLNTRVTGSLGDWRNYTDELRGIAAAKSGFVGSLLGRGDVPTLDARQLNLHGTTPPVGLGSIQNRGGGAGGRELVDRLSARQEALGLKLDPSLNPFYQHLGHHAVWDKIGNTETTHADLVRAMRDYNKGGAVHMAGGSLVKKAAKAATSRIDMNYKDVTQRTPELQDAANKLIGGELSAAEYDALVNQYKPVTPYATVPTPATREEATGALTADKRERYGLPSQTLEQGHPVGLRLDIPSYSNHGVWVPTVHEQEPGFGAGKSIGHESVASVLNPQFGMSEKAALAIASGKPKGTIATIKGDWNKLSEQEAVERAKEYLKSPEWRQVGMDPERHSYFYDRATMQPVTSADEALQIGPLVLVKNPVYGKKEDFKYAAGGMVDSVPEEAIKNMVKDPQAARLLDLDLAKYALMNQPQKMAAGGIARMAGGGARKVARDASSSILNKGFEALEAQAAQAAAANTIKAADRAAAGRAAAAQIEAQPEVPMSEALGNLNTEGKRIVGTQADRTRVGGGNIGGAPFSAISLADPNYQGKVWGVGSQSAASTLTNQNDPRTIWTTLLGSKFQLKTNPIVFAKLEKEFRQAMKDGKLSPELEAKINHNLALNFGEGADIRDPNIWKAADSFDRRAALSDIMIGEGIPPSKGGVALGGAKSGKGVIFDPLSILTRETEPSLRGDVPTFSLGPRLFTMSGETSFRPDLHPGFPMLLHGEDLGFNVRPVPNEIALPDYRTEFARRNPTRDPSYYDLTKGFKGEGLPSQMITEEWLSHLQKHGHKDGGAVHMKDGGKADEDLFALKPQPKPAIPTVRELVAEIGKNPARYEAPYPPKDATPAQMQAYRLMQAAKTTPDANRYLESLNPYFDSQLRFDIGAGNEAGYVKFKEPNIAVMQKLEDVKNTIPHELTHTLQLGKGAGVELERDRQVMQRAQALPAAMQQSVLPSDNRFENMKEVWANVNARAHEVNAAGGDFINSPEGRALFPTPEMQREYYTKSMPGVNSMTPSTGTFVPNRRYADGGGVFNPQGSDYDYQTARAYGMGQGDGNWGSVAPASEGERKLHGLPEDSYLMLKGAQHPTWGKAVEAEESRGSKVVKYGDRYYSVPKKANGGQVQRFDDGGEVSQSELDRMRFEIAQSQNPTSPVMQATPRSAMQDAIGTFGGYMDRAGKFVSEAIAPTAEKHPVKHFLADLILAESLKSAGTALQDYTGTAREADEDNPVRGVISKDWRNLTTSREPLLDPRALDIAGFATPVVRGATKLARVGAKAVAPFATRVDDMVRELSASGAIPQPGLSIKDVTPKALAPANAQGFYSPTEAAALNLQRKSGSGQALLNDVLKGENVRAEEVSRMGLDTFLKDNPNVTAAEVQDYIAKNKLQLGDRTYKKENVKWGENENGEIVTENLPNPYTISSEYGKTYITNSKNNTLGITFKNEAEAKKYIEDLVVDDALLPNDLKWAQWSLPGGENHREVTLNLPSGKREDMVYKEQSLESLKRGALDYAAMGDLSSAKQLSTRAEKLEREIEQLKRQPQNRTPEFPKQAEIDDLDARMAQLKAEGNREEFGKLQSERTELRAERSAYLAREEARLQKEAYTNQFRESHWEDPNVLAHLRMSDRVTDGKKTLLVDEVQSDWHQKGRERGYKGDEIDTTGWEVEHLYATRPDEVAVYDARGKEIWAGKVKGDDAQAIEKVVEELKKKQVPQAPYKDDWYQLVLRRAIKEAVDGGYDRVALPTGSEVAQRFGMGNLIDRIDYHKNSDGTYGLSAIKNGREVVAREYLKQNELFDIVGKEMGEKMAKGQGKDSVPIDPDLAEEYGFDSYKSLTGLDLVVGGKGMKKYYDEVYPNYLKKFGKKYGATIGETTVDADGVAKPLRYMDITPAMREEFKTGIHMKRGGKVSFASNVDAMRHELTQRQ
jgi:hypothetical protein